MAQMKLPTSRYLQLEEVKKVEKEAKTDIEKVFVIVAVNESSTNEEMLSLTVNNRLLGEKQLYDYKNKFRDFFDSYGIDSEAWIGKLLIPVLPTKADTLFFAKYETKGAVEEKIGE